MDNEIGYNIAYINAQVLQQSNNYFSTLSIFKCTKGSSIIIRNEVEYHFSCGDYFIYIETMSLIFDSWSDDFCATVCNISVSLSSEIDPYLDNRVWEVLYYFTPDMCSGSDVGLLDEQFVQILNIYNRNGIKLRKQLAFHTIINFAIVVYNVVEPYVPEEINNIGITPYKSSILDRFCILCSEYHITERNLDFYTNKLHVSQRHLYNLTQNSFKQTPKQVLDGYVIASIKKQLLTSTMSIQQIADSLEFADQSTLRQFFYRNVGMPPSEYRKRYND